MSRRSVPSESHDTDVAVVGAGPTGAAAAAAFARRGARVTLIDGHPDAAQRFAGEWIHPPGVRGLRALGVDTGQLSASEGSGFALFGGDGGDPVCLPYEAGTSMARVHGELVSALREHATGHASVSYLPDHQALGLDGNALELADRARKRRIRVRADRIIGADGRSSKLRALLGGPGESERLSYMAGLELKDARLPLEGLGHVFLGGPGPALLYRIDERRIRACLDVPTACGSAARRPEALFEAFRAVLPPQLEAALRAATREPIAWAATGFRGRGFFGRGGVWLAGDAVGHVHPLSGIGITLGVLDADAAARAASLAEYRQERDAHLAELVASVLYAAFSGTSGSAVRIRDGLLALLRESAFERTRTMKLLIGEDREGSSFASAFLRASGRVVLSGAGRTATREQSPWAWAGQLGSDARWLGWPLRALSTGVTRKVRRRAGVDASSGSSSGALGPHAARFS
jgi:2-polyprenyl-6-methoxyphenol hydroxylase-like FAD-dependent oxidoreductase